MVTLVSPGVNVSITDESFYTSAGPGTVPLIFIATKQDKSTPDGTAIAPGTLATNAERLYLVSSQRELLQTFGDPDFNEIGGTAQHGYALNEYGLLAAYSYLGISNRAYIMRADIDLAELDPRTSAPEGSAADNTYWVDLNSYVPGLFEWNGTAWVTKSVTLYENTTSANLDGALEPSSGFKNGDIIASFDDQSNIQYFERDSGVWELIGSASWKTATSGDFQWAPHTQVPSQRSDTTALVSGDLWLKTTTPNNGLSISVKVYDEETGAFLDVDSVVVDEDHAAYYARTNVDPTDVDAGTVVAFVDSNDAAGGDIYADLALQVHNGSSTTVASAGSPVSGTISGAAGADINGTTVSLSGGETIDGVVQAVNNAGITNIVATKTSNDVLVVTNTSGEDVVVANLTGVWAAEVNLAAGTYSNFSDISAAFPYEAIFDTPSSVVSDGTYWYNPSFTVDLLENDGAGAWTDFSGTVYVRSDDPVGQVTPAVSAGDLWVETDQAENYPVIYRRNPGNTAWVQIDNTDQTTPDGIVFADARVDPTQSAASLDADAPDPLLYPGGLLLWNTRYSGRNVKVWREDYTFEGTLIGDRWVNASGNQEDGSPYMGEEAVKRVIVKQFASAITSNEEIRADTIFYNLIATPGFPELMDEMLTLNTDRKETAFVIGDTPFHLAARTTELQAWATNANNAPSNGKDGLVSASPYLGVYYPSGFATNVDGSEVVVPASHMLLRTMAFNDQVAYPWFAPAGFSRGTVTNATAVGYLDDEDEFVTVTLNEGQRDVLYLNNVNPIAFIPNRGLVVFGQKTRNPVESALDRVNVARLVNYIRFQAERIAQPFLFEPNDRTTRAAVKEAFDTFFAELVTLRGVFDFLVVCDESNNTPARIDRNELWVDVAIQPVKAVEFIYIPIRVRNTGADLTI